MDNCVVTLDANGESFSCLDASGKPYTLFLKDGQDLVCFKSAQFMNYANWCQGE